MKKRISKIFIPLYKKYVKNISKGTELSEIQETADIIFYERAFISWLREKYNDALTEKSYPKFCTAKDFQAFLSSFIETKNTKENLEVKAAIENGLLSEKQFPPISTHEYDIDIVAAYFRIKKMIDPLEYLTKQITKEEYLGSVKYPIVDYCEVNKMPLDKVLQIQYPIVVDSTIYNFEAYLGRTLIAFDVNKIEAILSYQNILWKKKELFASFVEFGVYRFVLHNSPYDNKERLSKIMEWVEKNRIFISSEAVKENKKESKKESKKKSEKENKKEGKKKFKRKQDEVVTEKVLVKSEGSNGEINKGSASDPGYTRTAEPTFHYWPYSEEKLTELHTALLLYQKIESNDDFVTSFKEFTNFSSSATIWKTKQIQLVFLLYLIYKGNLRRGEPIDQVAVKLFKSKEEKFTYKGFNAALNQIRDKIKGKSKLSDALLSIQEIYDNLNLSEAFFNS